MKHWLSLSTYDKGTEYQSFFFLFKVFKSVHHRTIQINHQPDATVFQFITLTFIHSSTCFGRSPAHHQELNDCSSSLWFYLRIVVIAVLCSWSGRPASAPGDGQKHRPKHVGLTWNNKLTYTDASCWLLSQLYHDARIHEHQI